MRVRYIGPFIDGVDVVLGGFAGQDAPMKHVGHGEVFETSDDHAARLLEQATIWEPADPPEPAAEADEAEVEAEDDEKEGDA